jgi:hypothetical protein
LEDWLPPGYAVETKGRILGANGVTSPQVDVIVLKPSYPRFLRREKLYLFDGVAAAFECKTTLKTSHIREVMENAAAIARLKPRQPGGGPVKELFSPIVYGLLAHSHESKADSRSVVNRLTDEIRQRGRDFAREPRDLPELICIADLAGWRLGHSLMTVQTCFHPDRALRVAAANALQSQFRREGYPTGEVQDNEVAAMIQAQRPSSEYQIQFYPPHIDAEKPVETWQNFRPLGAFLSALYQKLAYRDTTLKDLSDYFSAVHVPGSSGGLSLGDFVWPWSVIDPETWNRLHDPGNGWQGGWFH